MEPSPRQGLTSILYDKKIYLFFGYGGINHQFDDFDDIYEFNIEHKVFKKIFQLGDIPSRRAGHSTALYNDKVILFGGFSGHSRCNDIYEFTFKTSTWISINPKDDKRPPPRSHHTGVIYKDGFYVFGGHLDMLKGPCDKVWKFDLLRQEWTVLGVIGDLPSPRSHHSCCLKDDCMIIFGGYNSPYRFNDLYSLSFDDFTWRRIDVNGTKVPRLSEHTATIFQNSMYIFGGFNGIKTSSSLKEFNFTTSKWSKVKCEKRPRKRYLHTTVLCDDSLIIFSGYDGQELSNDCTEIYLGPFHRSIKHFNTRLFSNLENQHFVDVEINYKK